jgi:hypothetical protein
MCSGVLEVSIPLGYDPTQMGSDISTFREKRTVLIRKCRYVKLPTFEDDSTLRRKVKNRSPSDEGSLLSCMTCRNVWLLFYMLTYVRMARFLSGVFQDTLKNLCMTHNLKQAVILLSRILSPGVKTTVALSLKLTSLLRQFGCDSDVDKDSVSASWLPSTVDLVSVLDDMWF